MDATDPRRGASFASTTSMSINVRWAGVRPAAGRSTWISSAPKFATQSRSAVDDGVALRLVRIGFCVVRAVQPRRGEVRILLVPEGAPVDDGCGISMINIIPGDQRSLHGRCSNYWVKLSPPPNREHTSPFTIRYLAIIGQVRWQVSDSVRSHVRRSEYGCLAGVVCRSVRLLGRG